MSPRPSILQVFLLLHSLYSASPSVSASPSPQKVVHLPFEKRQPTPGDGSFDRRIRRRYPTENATTYSEPLYNALDGSLYFINVTVGTPPQKLQLQVDTGSSDLWVPWVNNAVCQNPGICAGGTFDDSASSTFIEVGADDEFQISYADGSGFQGDYANETVAIGGTTIDQLQIALAKTGKEPTDTSPLVGIIGVGSMSGESIFSQTNGSLYYPNFIARLAKDGLINTKAYSMWLNTQDASSGSILFGGVDTAKYHGDLVVLPLLPDAAGSSTTPENITAFNVLLDNISILGNKQAIVYSSHTSLSVIIDSGSSVLNLPYDLATAIAAGVGVDSDGNVPCAVGSTGAIFNFQFGNSNGPKIGVPISELVSPSPGAPVGTCSWGISTNAANDTTPPLFGDSFMRSGYFVFDIDGQQVAMAQTNFNATKSNVLEITEVGKIPGVSSTATGAAPTGTGGATPVTATWNLGTATGTGVAAGGKPKSAGPSLQPPSRSITVAVTGGMVVLFAMVGGSVMIFV